MSKFDADNYKLCDSCETAIADIHVFVGNEDIKEGDLPKISHSYCKKCYGECYNG